MQSDSDPSLDGWQNANIVAALKLKGFTQRSLSIRHKLSPSAVSVALQKPWPKVEAIIAKAIEVPAHHIWPSRYDCHGVPIKRGAPKVSRGPNPGANVKKRCSPRSAREAA